MSKGVWYIARMAINTSATRFLDTRAIPYSIFTHSRVPASLDEAARERSQKSTQVIRSILFRVKPGQFVMVLVAGLDQVFWKTVRAHLGVSRLSMATENEVRQVTGCERGAVNPFGLPPSTRLLVDQSVFMHEEISIGCGVPGSAIIIKIADLRRVLASGEIGSFSDKTG